VTDPILGDMPADLISLFDYEQRARALLSSDAWSYIAGGIMDGAAVARNRAAFEDLTLRTQLLADAPAPTLDTTVLGSRVSLPVMLAPTGLHTIAHDDGELATARGAAQSGVLMIVGLRADHPVEEIARTTTAPLWFQLTYLGHDTTRRLVARAEEAGCRAIVLTIDAVGDRRGEATTRTGFGRELDARGLGHFRASLPPDGLTPRPVTRQVISWLRGACTLPLVLKGVASREDATVAVELGADALMVSNHGGRVLDSAPAAIESLAEVVTSVGDRAEVYLDSGIRRGSDVLKALALGARAVAIGRPVYWGLAVGGANGVHAVLELLREELSEAMQLCGQDSVENIDATVLGDTRAPNAARTNAVSKTSKWL
jgi:4-hydroxymandelate oxidase